MEWLMKKSDKRLFAYTDLLATRKDMVKVDPTEAEINKGYMGDAYKPAPENFIPKTEVETIMVPEHPAPIDQGKVDITDGKTLAELNDERMREFVGEEIEVAEEAAGKVVLIADSGKGMDKVPAGKAKGKK